MGKHQARNWIKPLLVFLFVKNGFLDIYAKVNFLKVYRDPIYTFVSLQCHSLDLSEAKSFIHTSKCSCMNNINGLIIKACI